MAAKIKTAGSHKSRRHKNKPRGISGHAFERVHWPYLPVLLVALFMLSISVQNGVLKAAVRNPTAKVLAYATSMSVGGLLSSTNSARAGAGAAALQLNSKLNAAAQAKAEDMAARNYWSHNTPEGNSPWIFVNNQGYLYLKLGENLAAGFDNEQATVNGWMASPSHKDNMLDVSFSEVGFGFASNANYTSAGGGQMTIVVAFYGKPTVPVAQASPPPPASQNTSPKSPTPIAAASPPPVLPSPTPSAQPAEVVPPTPEPQPQPSEQPQRAANTDAPKESFTLAVRTSRAELAFAQIPLSSFATGLMTFGMFAASGLWVSRHVFTLRRAFLTSEAYAFRHPLIDAGLITIAGVAFLLSQTAGFIL